MLHIYILFSGPRLAAFPPDVASAWYSVQVCAASRWNKNAPCWQTALVEKYAKKNPQIYRTSQALYGRVKL